MPRPQRKGRRGEGGDGQEPEVTPLLVASQPPLGEPIVLVGSMISRGLAS